MKRRHSTPITTEAASSNQIIQMYALFQGFREDLVWPIPMYMAVTAMTLAIPNTVDAMMTSERVIGAMK